MAIFKHVKRGWSLGHLDGVLGPVWWVRWDCWNVAVHSPRSKKLFSERNGHRVPRWEWRGWRVFVEKDGRTV